MSTVDDLQEILSKMPQAFVPERAANLDAVVQLELTGEGGGQWAVKIANGRIAIEQGVADPNNLTLTMDAGDYVALSLGEANPVNLFMAGKIKVEGDPTLALKFQDLFDRNRVDD